MLFSSAIDFSSTNEDLEDLNGVSYDREKHVAVWCDDMKYWSCIVHLVYNTSSAITMSRLPQAWCRIQPTACECAQMTHRRGQGRVGSAIHCSNHLSALCAHRVAFSPHVQCSKGGSAVGTFSSSRQYSPDRSPRISVGMRRETAIASPSGLRFHQVLGPAHGTVAGTASSW